MNFQRLIVITILTLYPAAICTTSISMNTFIGRPFSQDVARETLLEKSAWDGIPKPNSWHGTFQVALQYNQMFNEFGDATHGIGARPFWSGTNTMTVGNNANLSDNQYTGGPYDVDAWQFGLGVATIPGSITLTPKIHQAGATMLLYIGSRQYEPGFFAKIIGPISATVIDPGLTEQVPTCSAYPAGVMQIIGGNATTTTPPFNTSMAEAFTGNFSTNDTVAFVGLSYGKIDGKLSSNAQFANVHGTLGYNIIADEKRHIGIGLRCGAPTGNSPEAIYMLEPIAGNGNSWTAGIELIAHTTFLEKDHLCIKMWLDAYAIHIFKGRQIRSFDAYANGPGSKYLLTNDFSSTGNASQSTYQALINISTLAIDAKVNVCIDSALLLDIDYYNWNIGLGYNFWGKSQEHVSVEQPLVSGRYGFVGHQPNTNAGNPSSAENLLDPTAQMNQFMPHAKGSGITATPGAMINGTQALDITGACAQGAWSSKVFCRIAREWRETNLYPVVGLYASSEFSHSGNGALSQWAIGLQGGLSF